MVEIKILMMENIYQILKKHFLQQTSESEEKQIEKFINDNPQEYKMLYHLWWSNTDIELKDFDSNRAWEKVLGQVKQNQVKTIPIYTKLKRISAAAAILIAVSLSVFYISKRITDNEVIVQTDKINKSDVIILSDGSKIWLNKNAKFSYPEKFNRKICKVSLTGEAFFEIARNPEKPFIIETEHSEITVLGTSFNVNTDTIQTKVAVTTGKVNVKSVYSSLSINIAPNYAATVTQNNIEKTENSNPNYISWKTGKFIFEDTPIQEIITDLNSFYEKQIIIKNQQVKCQFSASFDQADLADIIEILELTCNIKIIENEYGYEIY